MMTNFWLYIWPRLW